MSSFLIGKTQHNAPLSTSVSYASALLCLVVSTTHAQSLASNLDFGFTASVRETWSDNVNSSIDSLATDDLITDLNAGFTVNTEGPRLKADVRYNAQILQFLNSSSASSNLNQLSANATLFTLKKRFSFNSRLSISQQQISNQAATVTSNLTSSANRTDVTTLTLNPTYTHPFGRFATLKVNAQRSQTSIEDGGTSGGTTESSDLSLRNGTAFRNLSWSLGFSSTNDKSTGSKSTGINVNSGYRIAPKTRLTLSLGEESNQAANNLSTNRTRNWSLAANWTISRRQSLRVSYGRRIFGRNFGLDWKLRLRRGNLSANYTENLQTINSQQSNQQVFDPITGLAVVANNQANLGSDQFLERNFSVSGNTARGRSRYSLSGSIVRREFQVSGNNELVQDLTAQWNLEINPRLNSAVTATIRRSRFDSTSRRDEFYDISWALAYEVRKDISASLQLKRSERTSSDITADFAANSLSISVSARF